MPNSKKGYVYVLTNPAMPGLVKVGKSILGGKMRANQLYTTGVPAQFDLYFEMMFDDCDEAESLVHELLFDMRSNSAREFFEIEPEGARIAIIEAWSKIQKYSFLSSEEHFVLYHIDKVAKAYSADIEAVAETVHFLEEDHFLLAQARYQEDLERRRQKMRERGLL
jgi:hypothetical protein